MGTDRRAWNYHHVLTESDRPWRGIDPATADVLKPVLPALVAHTVADIGRRYPDLSADLVGRSGGGLHAGIEEALTRFLDLLGSDLPALDDELCRVFESFGAREDRRGRSLATLLAAYRDGARGAWRQFSEAALAHDVPQTTTVRLAEAIFVYIDELSTASAIGFAQAQVTRASQRDLLRRAVAEAVLAGESGTAAPRVHELASRAAWTVPVAAAVAVFVRPGEGTTGSPPLTLPILHPDVLVSDRGEEIHAILPDWTVEACEARLAALPAGGLRTYLGTIRPLAEAPISLAHARAVRRLAARGLVPNETVISATRHLPMLVLQADRRLLAGLIEAELAPLEEIAKSRRTLLTRTLRSWLLQHGDRGATARDLGVHPQTVSYRLAELRRVFGAALEDPQRRFALTMALVGAVDRERGEVRASRGVGKLVQRRPGRDAPGSRM